MNIFSLSFFSNSHDIHQKHTYYGESRIYTLIHLIMENTQTICVYYEQAITTIA